MGNTSPMPGGVIIVPGLEDSSEFYEDIIPAAGNPYGGAPQRDILSEYGEHLLRYARRTVEWWSILFRNPRHPPSVSSYPLPLSYDKEEFIEVVAPFPGLPDLCTMYDIEPRMYGDEE